MITDPNKKMRVSTGSAAVLDLRNVKVRSKNKTVYLMNSGGCEYNCSFCAQARDATSAQDKLARVTWPEYETEKVLDALNANQDSYKRVCMQVVNTPGVLEQLPETVRSIRKKTPNAKIAMTVRTYKMEDVDALFAAGSDEVGLSIDSASPKLFAQIKGGNFHHHKQFILDAADKYVGKIATHIIVGMGETERELVDLMKELNDHKVIIALFAFTPVRGAKMQMKEAPTHSSYRRVQLALHLMRNNLFRGVECNHYGQIVNFGYSKEELYELVKGQNCFETSGCSDCNRPYYNERAGSKDLYNYPEAVEDREFRRIFDSVFEYEKRGQLRTSLGQL
jgi:biotin synthase